MRVCGYIDENGEYPCDTQIDLEFDHYWHHVANHSTVNPSDTFRYAFGLQDLKLKELEKKLALAEGEWKTYAKSCESLSKKLAEANEMLTSSGIDELQNRLKVAVEALEFYANKGHWKHATGDMGNSYETRQSVPDYELTQARGPFNNPSTRIFTAGKCARLALEKIKVK